MSNSSEYTVKRTKKNSLAAFGTGAFAVLNIIAFSVYSLIGIIGIFIYWYETVAGTEKIDAFLWSLCLGINLLLLIVLMFGVILLLGIYKKKSSYVLVYFIFGVFIDITLVSGVIAANCAPLDVKNIDKRLHVFVVHLVPISKAIICICVFYTLILAMIYRTWVLMRSRRTIRNVSIRRLTDCSGRWLRLSDLALSKLSIVQKYRGKMTSVK